MTADLLSALLGAALVLFVPGPTNTLLATAGAAAHGRPPLRLALAELAGYLVSTNLLWLLGGVLTEAAPVLAPAIRLGLAGYLVLLGCCLWRSDETAAVEAVVSSRRIFVTTLVNPKAAIFAFVLMPADGATALALWTLGFAAVVLAADVSWLVLGHRIRCHGGRRAAALVPKVASLALFGFAALIAERTIVALV